MSIYKILSVLLEYPSDELLAGAKEIRAAAAGLPEDQRVIVEGFLDEFESSDLIEFQGEYVQTFDLTPEHSLHLTHHVFGDDKNRGPALIDLGELYKQYGLMIQGNEIPDYLPMVLEFAAVAPAEVAERFLADAGKVLAVLAANLEKADSPWAPLVQLVHRLSGGARPLICGRPGDASPEALPCGSVPACGAEIM